MDYCKQCFRDTVHDTCTHCVASVPVSRIAAIAGGIGLAAVVTGMLTLNVVVCLIGAIVGVAAALVHVFRVANR
jgi:hypothetical protein